MNILKQEIIYPKKRGTLTEPHYMFYGTPVEEHWLRVYKVLPSAKRSLLNVTPEPN